MRDTMPKKTTTTTSADATTTTPEAASVEALRALPSLTDDARDLLTAGVAAVLDALARPAPAFLDTLPRAGATDSELAPADRALYSHTWPDRAGVGELLARLRAMLSSAAALDLFGDADALPVPYYSGARLSFRPGDAPNTKPTAGHHKCDLTGRAFTLPPGAPVPVLLFDAPGTTRPDPLDLPDRSVLHPAEYAEAEFDAPHSFDVHPALVEAGPAHVLGAAWRAVEWDLMEAAEKLADVYDRAAVLSGLEPEALGVEWPARAYRRWDAVERTGEARTWKRELAGVK